MDVYTASFERFTHGSGDFGVFNGQNLRGLFDQRHFAAKIVIKAGELDSDGP